MLFIKTNHIVIGYTQYTIRMFSITIMSTSKKSYCTESLGVVLAVVIHIVLLKLLTLQSQKFQCISSKQFILQHKIINISLNTGHYDTDWQNLLLKICSIGFILLKGQLQRPWEAFLNEGEIHFVTLSVSSNSSIDSISDPGCSSPSGNG